MELFAPDTIFGELPLEVQAALSRMTQTREIAKGEVVFHEGEPGIGLHFVQSGLVKIVKMNEEGREHIKEGRTRRQTTVENHMVPAVRGGIGSHRHHGRRR